MGMKTNYSLAESDWDFVKELTKVAHIHVLSSQVSIYVKSSHSDFGTDSENPLIFPSNWSLEYVSIVPSKYEDNHMVSMTWKVLKKKNINLNK